MNMKHVGSAFHVLVLVLVVLGLTAGSADLPGQELTTQLAGAPPTVDFQRDVLPILSDHCLTCHGVDEGTREGGLRLDIRDHALAGGDSEVPAIAPGDVAGSELWARITSDEPGVVMPPPSMNRPLSDAQRSVLRSWIQQGAPYDQHWGFVPPERPDMGRWQPGEHPLDHLVRRRLQSMGREWSPPAEPQILARRLYLDLIGLPPSPEETQRYIAEGHEATVEALLARPQYGERWARPWLDAARYSDTNGYEKDLRRDQWIWRDWVIQSLNRDQPYDQFIIEQVAGDLLPDASQEQKIATGFLRNSMLNEEGAIIPEEFRMVEMFDRVDCVGRAVMGLTTQCAQCHSHKFDPLTHHEYYGLFAFLNNSYEAQSWVYSPEQQATLDDVRQAIEQLEAQLRTEYPTWLADLSQWVTQSLQTQLALPSQVGWEPVVMQDMGSVSGLNHPVQLSDRSITMLGHTSNDVYFLAAPDMDGVTGVRLEVLTHGDLPFLGPGRSSIGTWDIQEFEVWTRQGDSEWKKESLLDATADWSEPERTESEGKVKIGPVALLIDGDNGTRWQADRGIGRRNQDSVAIVRFAEPLSYPAGTQVKFVMRMGAMVGRCRVSLTKADSPAAAPWDYAAQRVVAEHWPADRSPEEAWNQLNLEQQQVVFSAWRATVSDWQEVNAQIAQQWARYPRAMTSVLHLAEREPQAARPTFLLDRGMWNAGTEPVEPHTPAFLHAPEFPVSEFAAQTVPPRLQFARWLVSPQSPLAARVAVNRVWQAIFGRGLVSSPEDFGTRAAPPEHLEVLDWLAVEFMERGWSQKELIRLIVTSETYRQDSRVTPDALEWDPENRWLARGPRFRADAEVVRDIALSAAGLLSLEMGGPSVIPPVPQNVLDYNYTYPSYWTAATGSQRYRRTVYGFRKRSMPDPATSNFDAPNGDTACVKRVRSNTPLAALTGLNETIFVEAARGLAGRVLREAPQDESERIKYAFSLCTGRLPTDTEIAELTRFLETQRQRLADGWLDPKLIATGEQKMPDIPAQCTPQDVAAWVLASRVLLNLDETVTKQ